MKNRALLFGICLFGLLIFGCGGSKQALKQSNVVTDDSPCPAWFSELPSHADTLYQASTATSKDLQMAINKAVLDARNGIGGQVETRIKSLQERLMTDVGEGVRSELTSAMESVIQGIVNLSLSGSKVRKQSSKKEDEGWRACVMVTYPIGAANKAFVDNLKREKIIAGRQDLRDAVQRMEQTLNKPQ